MSQKVTRLSAKGLAHAIKKYGPLYEVESRSNPTRSILGFPIGFWNATLVLKSQAAIASLSGQHKLPEGRGSFGGEFATASGFNPPDSAA